MRSWSAPILLAVELASLSWGVTSGGGRGLLFGLIVPAVCISCVALLTDMLIAMLAGIAIEVAGIGLASMVGSNLDGALDASINLMPLLSVAAVLFAAGAGMLCRIAADSWADRRRIR